MDIRDDISVIADLVADRGGEADRNAWARVRAELDDLRARLRELMRLTETEELRRLQIEKDRAQEAAAALARELAVCRAAFETAIRPGA